MLEKILKEKYKYLTIFMVVFILLQGLGKSASQSDFFDYYRASRLFAEHKDIYQWKAFKSLGEDFKVENLFQPETFDKFLSLKGNIGTYIYPPLFAFLIIPITGLEYEIASAIFIIINSLSLVLALFFTYHLLEEKDFFFAASFWGLLFSYRFLESHVTNNQVTFILLALVLGAIYIEKKFDTFTGKSISAILLSLAIIIKITPAIFILYFFLKRSYLVIFLTLVFGGLWMLVPSVYGFEYNLGLIQNWNELVLQSAMKNPIFRAWRGNQSLVGTLAKYFLIGADPENQIKYGMPFYASSPVLVKYIFYSISFLLIAPVLFLKERGNKMISILFILSVVLSGISWLHAFSFLLFPSIFFISEILSNKTRESYKYILFTIGCLNLFTMKSISGKIIEESSLMFSLFLYTSIIFYFLILTGKKKEA
jgi:hypothetical protein